VLRVAEIAIGVELFTLALDRGLKGLRVGVLRPALILPATCPLLMPRPMRLRTLGRLAWLPLLLDVVGVVTCDGERLYMDGEDDDVAVVATVLGDTSGEDAELLLGDDWCSPRLLLKIRPAKPTAADADGPASSECSS